MKTTQSYPPLLLVTAWVLASGCSGPPAGEASAPQGAPPNPLREHAQASLERARAAHHAASAPTDAAWRLGSACFERAEFAVNDAERVALAKEGAESCRRLLAAQPKSAEGHYYLAMNLGQLARVKKFEALGFVKEMESSFLRARDLNATFSHAGPDRNLGLLYFKAPGWPVSIGSDKKAREHLRRAAELAPGFPDNRLNLLEAHLKWRNTAEANAERAALEKLLPAAREQFAGPDWSASWVEWQARWETLRGPGLR